LLPAVRFVVRNVVDFQGTFFMYCRNAGLHTGKAALLGVCAVSVLLGGASISRSQPAKKPAAAKKPTQPLPPPIPPEALLSSAAWKDLPRTPLQAGEIDRLLEKEFRSGKILPAPVTTDEQFLRRVRLDLTGQLPTTAEIEQFLADRDADKRAKWIDKLLGGDDYARHWARYWRYAVSAVEAPFGNAHAPAFEDWLFEQFKHNRNWGEIARALMTAEGSLKKKDADNAKHGAIFFLGRHNGPDGDDLRAAETARLFLGIQIQCAQCHNDRRTRIWKQFQFHELAGFFARMQVGGSFGDVIKVTSRPKGEHRMPGRQAKQFTVTYPRFLDGKMPAADASDQERRTALADFLTAGDNYWFSAAYVNRIWNELLGQAFYDRVDDLSPKTTVIFPSVAGRLAAAFQGSGYDTKTLIRAIVNSKAYQRRVWLGKETNEHMRFAAVYPARLHGEVLWQMLGSVLGGMPTAPFVLKSTLGSFKSAFDFDPSLKADEVQGSIAQALWLLNSPVVNDRVKVGDIRNPPPPKDKGKGAKGAQASGKNNLEPTVLKQLLTKHGNDDPALVRALYRRTLARNPTDRELEICLHFVQETTQGMGTRNEAFEDIFKALINTAEFQRRR
jgi:hypothetical protein